MIEGSLVALITPFLNDEIDEDALRKMVRWQIEQGTDGIVPMGTTGESATLNVKEHTRVTEIVVEETAARNVCQVPGPGGVEALRHQALEQQFEQVVVRLTTLRDRLDQ